MLEHLFGSKARVKILKLFLLNPNEKFYIRQISRDSKLQLNSVRRELENLEKFGLLLSGQALEEENQEIESIEEIFQNSVKKQKEKAKTKKALPKSEKKYFQVDKGFVLYREVRELIVKAQILYEKDFIEKLDKIGSTKLLIFTGFFVNDEEMPVDLLLVGRYNKSKLGKLIGELEKELGREINFTLMKTHEFKYRRDITDIFLYRILEGKRITVINELI